jgi:hypothetical protein
MASSRQDFAMNMLTEEAKSMDISENDRPDWKTNSIIEMFRLLTIGEFQTAF